MAKIGRNDPCPCGSGKKYKKCCISKISTTKHKDNQEIPEDQAVKNLLEDETFRKFYKSEREKIPSRITWIKDTSLPPGIDYRSRSYQSGMRVILMRDIPRSKTEATSIAHELAHFLVELRGLPSVCISEGSTLGLEDLNAALSSMVKDPFVLGILKPFGFNLSADFRTRIDKYRKQLEDQSNSPEDLVIRLLWAINYVGLVLESRVIGELAEVAMKEYQEWFNARYPNMVAENTELLQLVDETGFNEPASMKAIFLKVIEQYKLQEYIKLF